MSDLKVRAPKESELLRRFPPRTSLASLGMTSGALAGTPQALRDLFDDAPRPRRGLAVDLPQLVFGHLAPRLVVPGRCTPNRHRARVGNHRLGYNAESGREEPHQLAC